MKSEATLIFDIGKTNKKLFVLDTNFRELHKEYVRFDQVRDDDGDLCDDLDAIAGWVLDSTSRLLCDERFEIKKINFSTYGASMVHLNKEGKVVVPFYNYLKDFPDDLKDQFFEMYGGEATMSMETASPSLGFLNSGLQLYYLKYRKPNLFRLIAHSLHLPQYLSFLFTQRIVSEFTSIGCHTFLWDQKDRNYARWLVAENLTKLLPLPSEASGSFEVELSGRNISVGIGAHDSSASLIPYLVAGKKPFALISTGTWSICINPFNQKPITDEELRKDCLHFLLPSGQPMKASRLFLGKEIREQAIKIAKHFDVEYHRYKDVKYDPSFIPVSQDSQELVYSFNHLDVELHGFAANKNETNFSLFASFGHAYHQLMHELTDLQIQSLKLVLVPGVLDELFIDGGFSDNELFVQMIANKLPDYTIKSTKHAMGSSLGAAILVNQDTQNTNFFANDYQPTVHRPRQKKVLQ